VLIFLELFGESTLELALTLFASSGGMAIVGSELAGLMSFLLPPELFRF
jgi:hypothetical protein